MRENQRRSVDGGEVGTRTTMDVVNQRWSVEEEEGRDHEGVKEWV